MNYSVNFTENYIFNFKKLLLGQCFTLIEWTYSLVTYDSCGYFDHPCNCVIVHEKNPGKTSFTRAC